MKTAKQKLSEISDLLQLAKEAVGTKDELGESVAALMLIKGVIDGLPELLKSNQEPKS